MDSTHGLEICCFEESSFRVNRLDPPFCGSPLTRAIGLVTILVYFPISFLVSLCTCVFFIFSLLNSRPCHGHAPGGHAGGLGPGRRGYCGDWGGNSFAVPIGWSGGYPDNMMLLGQRWANVVNFVGPTLGAQRWRNV